MGSWSWIGAGTCEFSNTTTTCHSAAIGNPFTPHPWDIYKTMDEWLKCLDFIILKRAYNIYFISICKSKAVIEAHEEPTGSFPYINLGQFNRAVLSSPGQQIGYFFSLHTSGPC